ncbi:hypothetical protein [Mycobacteroides abscessus]|uniref:hypothetical protein n=1 Tax=Mycobacteroides abscessus TaxID=36809 RepID=UPI000929E1BA|nr:hypothetical protein [Mycobacteroides abscessus]MDO3103209.1 hypothetical protein [Mycobacteroides abscessus subsp. abscessus]RIR03830.1 hypothetical protein D2E35_05720 [Mycobacteroides abscessus]RIR31789.1 hypothetical protein D2E36_26390 [Mycobacteroides abscessus]RIR40811.1 hypothetical protein D2E38_00830 [Mycobacteroides abscessus]RIS41878.1 hypothetical protein D2E71_16875 [Mycobacteroides abscessus]
MSNIRVFTAARATGNLAWWVFVVAALVNRGLCPRGWDYGWTAYMPLTGGAPRRYADYVPTQSVVGVVVWVAFAAAVVAAVVELAIVRRWIAVGTVVIPFASLGLIAYAFGEFDRTITWSPTGVLFFALVAVAIRQVWMRRFAPAVGVDQ